MALRRMVLRHFVVVQSLDLDLHTGFTVLSGETGAGKSILIDALQLVLGARADALWVRQGEERAEVAAEFDIPPDLLDWLTEHGFDHTATDGLVLRRTVDTQGRSRSWINGSVATATQLRTVGEHLVDIHGQHAWQSLTRASAVRALLDGYAGSNPQPVQQAWQVWRRAQEALQHARQNEAQLQQRREMLQWQLGELAKLAPRPGEWEELNADHTRLSHTQTLQDTARQAWAALEDEGAASTGIHRALQLLQTQASLEPRFAEWGEILQAAASQVADVAHSLSSYGDAAEPDTDTLQALDERVGQWLSQARRYRVPPDRLPALVQQWQDELTALEHQADLEQLQAAQTQAQQHYQTLAQALSHQRAQAAPRLSGAISAAMQALGMPGGRFVVHLDALAEPAAHGLDGIEFQVAGHAGASPRPIGKVASGGELSRISLAIAVTTSQLGATPTLIFDEVDSGVGGAVAETVGRLMRQLGGDRQVLAVTHLPQVAACAHHHLLVRKQPTGQSVSSTVQPVQEAQRVEEIARMLGGETITATTRAHAREMLDGAAASPVVARSRAKSRKN